jgi:hypothetical protein
MTSAHSDGIWLGVNDGDEVITVACAVGTGIGRGDGPRDGSGEGTGVGLQSILS